jgi:hypothetical protein
MGVYKHSRGVHKSRLVFCPLSRLCHLVATQADILFKLDTLPLMFASITLVLFVGRARGSRLLCLWTAHQNRRSNVQWSVKHSKISQVWRKIKIGMGTCYVLSRILLYIYLEPVSEGTSIPVCVCFLAPESKTLAPIYMDFPSISLGNILPIFDMASMMYMLQLKSTFDWHMFCLSFCDYQCLHINILLLTTHLHSKAWSEWSMSECPLFSFKKTVDLLRYFWNSKWFNTTVMCSLLTKNTRDRIDVSLRICTSQNTSGRPFWVKSVVCENRETQATWYFSSEWLLQKPLSTTATSAYIYVFWVSSKPFGHRFMSRRRIGALLCALIYISNRNIFSGLLLKMPGGRRYVLPGAFSLQSLDQSFRSLLHCTRTYVYVE